ncbi:MAG TPA: hypothetical protein VIM84_07275, partial [Gemmatimonadales bacterium]
AERDSRLLLGYRLFDEGKPAAIDTLRAFIASYPDDVEGWYLLGESLYHIQAYRPTPPDSVAAVFDSVLRRDSTLFPALIHPMELGLLYRDRGRFDRYFPRFERATSAPQVNAMRTAAEAVWGHAPSDSALAGALRSGPVWIIQAAFSFYDDPAATSDSVLRLFDRVQAFTLRYPAFLGRSLAVRAHVLAGTGRWREAKAVLDSLRRLDPEQARGIEAWAIVLGVAPASLDPVLDTVVRESRAPYQEYGRAMLQIVRGKVGEGRRLLARALGARDSASIPEEVRGLMIAGDGWAQLLQGDSLGGIRRMRTGLDLSAAPPEESAYLRFQLALALAARPETRAEGIQWLRYGFEMLPLN